MTVSETLKRIEADLAALAAMPEETRATANWRARLESLQDDLAADLAKARRWAGMTE